MCGNLYGSIRLCNKCIVLCYCVDFCMWIINFICIIVGSFVLEKLNKNIGVKLGCGVCVC